MDLSLNDLVRESREKRNEICDPNKPELKNDIRFSNCPLPSHYEPKEPSLKEIANAKGIKINL